MKNNIFLIIFCSLLNMTTISLRTMQDAEENTLTPLSIIITENDSIYDTFKIDNLTDIATHNAIMRQICDKYYLQEKPQQREDYTITHIKKSKTELVGSQTWHLICNQRLKELTENEIKSHIETFNQKLNELHKLLGCVNEI